MVPERVRTRDPERKKKIMSAASELIARNGYHAVSMADIGQRAGITGSGIYRHFEGKSTILVSLFDEIIDDLLTGEAETLNSGDSSEEVLARLVDDQVEFVVGKRALAQVYFTEIQNLPYDDSIRLRRKQRLYVEEWVHLLRETRRELDDANARTLVHAAIGAVQSSLFHNVGLEEMRERELLRNAALSVLALERVAA